MNELFLLMKHELVVTAILFLLLFIKIGGGMKNSSLLGLTQLLLLLNVVAGFVLNTEGQLFGTMFFTDPMIVFQKNLLNISVYLITLVCSGWLLKTAHLAEFLLLMLSALLGMFFMISSGNLLIFYLALELATIPVAAMANFDLDKKISSEGAMKMIMSSAFSSGILLFGISLVYGTTGTILFHEIPGQINGSPVQVLGFLFFFSAFAFKLSVVPFHLWTADVYEGSPVATTSFLSVASKGAAAFIFMTMLYRVFLPLAETWYTLLVVLAIATMLIGNLFALRQQNLKRFLAFSSIAQVGFILVGMSASSPEGMVSVVFFVLVYIFSNLAAFGVIGAISDATGRENMDDYRGLYKTNPFLCWIMALALFSLAGIPPTAGFFGKLFLITAGAARGSYIFLTIAALNMVISLYYYLKIVRAMFMETNDDPVPPVRPGRNVVLGLLICGAGILLAGILSWVYSYIQSFS
jgi:NADH-quinone oxidoreductase subunit N